MSPEVIDALVAAGVTVEQLAAAVKADLALANDRDVARRAKAAAKKRRQRGSVPVCPLDTGGQTGTTGDTATTPLIEELVPPSPPKGGSSPTGAALAETRPRKPKTGSRFVPPDFTPSPDHHAKAEAMGLTAGDLERAINRFRNHEFPRPYSDWNRTFTNWLDREKPSDARPDPRHAARQANYEAAWAGADRALEVLAARRAF